MNKQLWANKFAADMAWMAGGKIIVTIAGLFGLRILTELAAPEVFGEANLILGLIGLGTHFAIAPIQQSQLRFHPEYAKDQQLGLFLRVILYLVFTASLALCVVVGIIFGFDLFDTGPERNLILALIISVYIIVSAIRGVFKNALNGERRQKLYASWFVLEAVLILAFVSLLLWRAPTTASFLAGHAFALTSTLIIFMMLGAWKLFSVQENQIVPVPVKSILKDIIKFGWPFIIFALLGWLSNLMDRYVLAAYMDLKTVGKYVAIFAIGNKLPMFPALVLNEVFRPVLYQAVAVKDEEKWSRVVRLWLLAMVSSGILMIGFVFFMGQNVANILLAAEYRDGAAQLLLIVTCGFVALSLAQAVELMAFSLGNSSQLIAPKAVAAGVTVALCFALIPSFSAVGAAYANAGGQIFLLLASVIVLKIRHSSIKKFQD